MVSVEPQLITKSRLVTHLRQLGVRPAQVIMVHASIKAIGWIVGGPDTVLHALLDILTPEGTLMMYVSWEEWERVLVHGLDHLPDEQRHAYLEECPPFDPATSRANRQWSILTENLRTWPGACRSNHPTASVVAVGAHAQWLTADHPLAYGYGRGSPFGKLCEAGGYVLLLGAPFSAITLLHHAEHLARVANKPIVRNRVPILRNGRRVWLDFEEFDTCEGIRGRQEEYFEAIAHDYLASGSGSAGKVGAADAYLFAASELAEFAIRWMEQRWQA